jgi:hypothetical protein
MVKGVLIMLIKNPLTMFTIKYKGDENDFVFQCAKTRSGFKHECHILSEGLKESVYVATSKYQNRTWESFEYESTLKRVLSLKFKELEKINFELSRIFFEHRRFRVDIPTNEPKGE